MSNKPLLLIVDDDPLISDTLSCAFAADFDVVTSHSRPHCLALLRQLRQTPPLALIDLGLPPKPHRPDEGFALIGDLLALAPQMKIIVCEPEDAQLLASGAEQARNPDGSASAGHAAWKPHPMQGWTPDFIPKLTGEVDWSRISKVITIAAADAMKSSMDLAQKEGVFVGITSGAAFAGALEVAKTAPKGSNILAMLPDTGERYLSTPLFANTPAEMTPEEIEIMKSTPYAAPAA